MFSDPAEEVVGRVEEGDGGFGQALQGIQGGGDDFVMEGEAAKAFVATMDKIRWAEKVLQRETLPL